jgi:hypothetical protein
MQYLPRRVPSSPPFAQVRGKQLPAKRKIESRKYRATRYKADALIEKFESRTRSGKKMSKKEQVRCLVMVWFHGSRIEGPFALRAKHGERQMDEEISKFTTGHETCHVGARNDLLVSA